MADVEQPTDEVLFRAAARADTLRAAGLRGVEEATRARQLGLEREHGRLSAALGTTHPRTLAIGERIKDGTARLRNITLEAARAETPAPGGEPGEWILHGYVRDKDLKPAPDLTVSLVDAQGRVVEALGFACTDARGYFRIAAAVGSVSPGSPRAAESATSQQNVYISVTDANHTRLYRGPESIATTPGAVEYREIVLGQDVSGCAPPADTTEPVRPSPEKNKSAPRRAKSQDRE